MNKSQFISALAENQGTTKAQAQANLDAVLNTLQSAIATDGSVQFVGFGSFTKSTRAARTGVNPSTGKSIDIPAKNVIKFKAGKAFTESIN